MRVRSCRTPLPSPRGGRIDVKSPYRTVARHGNMRAALSGARPGLALPLLLQAEYRMMDQLTLRLAGIERQSLNEPGRAITHP